MNKTKLRARFLLCALMVVLVVYGCFAVTAKNEENYDILIKSGFSKEYLDKLSASMIEKMAEKVTESSNIQQVDKDKKSFEYPDEILKELPNEALKHLASITDNHIIDDVKCTDVNLYGMDDIEMKKMVARLVDKKKDTIAGENIIIYWKWKEKRPLVTRKDYITVRFNHEKFCYNSGSFFAQDYYKNAQQDRWIVADTFTKLSHTDLVSIGHWTKLYATKEQTGGVMIFSLVPTAPIDVSQEYSNSIYVDYNSSTHKQEYKQIAIAILCIAIMFIVMFAVFAVYKKKRKS